ncbi:MAG: hypothetical protein NZ990_07200 [Myxococcota bacterium]|nr:hypothetical protein [Myxococcota bacterium]
MDGRPMAEVWLHGPFRDLAFGCGLFSMAMMLALAGFGSTVIQAWFPIGAIVLLFSLPHYGATLLRVYEEKEDRVRYFFVAVPVTLAMVAVFVVGVEWTYFGSLVLTLYLTWSPWHYTGQNYGIAAMMLGRAGTPLAGWRRRVLRLSFSSSYVLTFLAMHGSEQAANYTPVAYQGSHYSLIPIGLPEAIAAPAMALAALVWCSSTAVAGYLALKAAGAEKKRAVPALLLLLTQSLWFVVPAAMRRLDVATGSPEFASVFTAYGFLWVAAAHALQYLWITSYYDGKAHPERTSRMGRVGYFARVALCGYAVWVLPAVLLAPGYLGRLSAEAGLSLMVAAVVNLHHFILDGAVWKLRDKRVASALISSAGPADGASPHGSSISGARSPRSWLAPLIYALGAVALSFNLLTSAVDSWAFRGSLARGDLSAAKQATGILGRLGAASSSRQIELANAYARTGNSGQARRQFEESLRIDETVKGWRGLALLSEQSRDWEAALDAYDRALLVREDDVAALYRSGQVLMWMDELERAVARLERAAALAPEQEAIATTLRRAKIRFEGDKGS